MPNTNIKFRLDIPKLKSTFLSVLKKNMIKKEAIISKTLETEGGYVNDPSDSGGETYCGIARNSNPKWEGWKIVDAHKPLKWNQKIQDSILERLVIEIYDTKYYQPIKADKIDSDMIRTHLYDMGVNAGTGAAVKILQKAINKVYGISIATDGAIGNITLTYTNNKAKLNELVNEFINQRRLYYQDLVKRKPTNQKFLKGWLNRVDITTEFVERNSK